MVSSAEPALRLFENNKGEGKVADMSAEQQKGVDEPMIVTSEGPSVVMEACDAIGSGSWGMLQNGKHCL